MKTLQFIFAMLFVVGPILANNNSKTSLTTNFVYGDPEIGSVNSLSFGPEGILFIGDSKNAVIYAINTNDNEIIEKSVEFNIEGFDEKVAATLGTTADNIEITDLAVNPLSKAIYLSIGVFDGTPVLLKMIGETFEQVSLTNAHYSKTKLESPVEIEAERRGRPLRKWAVSDLLYKDGYVMVSGLSNKEFAATFRKIAFPFTNEQDYASLEVYHAAHGRYETYAPIKSFDVVELDGKDYLLASYTCTPLVLFPMETLVKNKHIKGRTIAELGAGNSPVDMISFEKDGEQYFYMSNTNRPVMRIKLDDIAKSKDNLIDPVDDFGATAGLVYDSLPFVNVLQMDDLDAENVVLLMRTRDGDLIIKNRSKEWM